MTGRRRRPTPAGGNARSRFVAKKQPTPAWILVTFIGLPSVVIVILVAMLVRNLVTSEAPVVEQEPNPNLFFDQARSLYNDASKLIARAKKLSDGGSVEESDRLYGQALSKLSKARNLMNKINAEIKQRLNVEELPEEYAGYSEFTTKIAQRIQDVIRMKPFGLGLRRK